MPQIQTPTPSETMIVKAKDLINLTGCSRTSSFKLLKDIKEEYNLKNKQVTYHHLKKYLSIT